MKQLFVVDRRSAFLRDDEGVLQVGGRGDELPDRLARRSGGFQAARDVFGGARERHVRLVDRSGRSPDLLKRRRRLDGGEELGERREVVSREAARGAGAAAAAVTTSTSTPAASASAAISCLLPNNFELAMRSVEP